MKRLGPLCLAFLALTGFPQTVMAEPLSYPGDKNYGWVVSSYFDQGGVSDWNCGSNTYSGHKGTDFAILGSWAAMAEGRPVLAAAAGTVEVVHDGEPDMCMSGNCGGGGGWGNHIRIAHPDGTRTLYAHLKTWSVEVSEGQEVACGQQIGLVGSSGNSTGPHLHFEKRATVDYASIRDPFIGPCSPGPGDWIDQGIYNDLPGTSCPDVIAPWPSLSLEAGITPLPDQEPDFNPQGASAGIFDAYVGQTVVIAYTLTNSTEESAVAHGVRVGFELSSEWSLDDWLILDNWPQNPCGGDWCPNDSNDLPENLPPEQLGSDFLIELGPLSPGESKRVELTLLASAQTPPQAHASAAYYVAHVDDVYEKASYDAAPNNVDDRQTWGDGDLKLLAEVDLYPEPDSETAGTTDSTTGTSGTSATTVDDSLSQTGSTDSGTATDGGTTSGTGEAVGTMTLGSSDSASLPPDFGSDDEGGCACETTRSERSPGWSMVLLLGLGLCRYNFRRRTN